MRGFVLIRDEDVTGVSGTGTVAEGVQFVDGHVAMRWIVVEHRSVSVWQSIEDAIAVHGHNGATRVQWLDEPGLVEQYRLQRAMDVLRVMADGLERDFTANIPLSSPDRDWDPNDEFKRCAVDRMQRVREWNDKFQKKIRELVE